MAGSGWTPRLAKVAGVAPAQLRREGRTSLRWLLLVGAGLGLTAAAAAAHLHLGTAAAPFTGSLRAKIKIGSPLAPAVAVGVLLSVRSGLHQRLAWRPILALSYLGCVAWTCALAVVDGGNGFARPVNGPYSYFADVPAVGNDPIGFVRTFLARGPSYTAATRGHPPAPVLLLWSLGKLGVHSPAALGVIIAALGCLTAPFVAVAVRALCGEQAARQLLPVLVLAPYAVWVAVSMDAVTTAIAAAALACGVLAACGPRSARWSLGAGLLLGLAALFDYAVVWLGLTLVTVFFVRRRVAPLVLTALAAMIPLAIFRLWGFAWPAGLGAARQDFAARVADSHNGLLWAVLDLLLLLIACGPVLLAALRDVRRTPGWPFLVGAGVAVIFTVSTGLARGQVERSWLPFFPWLLTPASAESRVPLLLVALGAVTAVTVQSVLRTAW